MSPYSNALTDRVHRPLTRLLHSRVPGALVLVVALWAPCSPVAAQTREAAAPQESCAGDCNGDGFVTIDELVTMINIALGDAAFAMCPAGAGTIEGTIEVDDIIAAIDVALDGCTARPTPTATATATPTLTFTPAAICGNGIWQNEAPETCDDGNTREGDGCSANCQVEFGYICANQPSECSYYVACPDPQATCSPAIPTATPTLSRRLGVRRAPTPTDTPLPGPDV